MNGAQLKRLLENPGLFPETLNTATSYERTQDDCDGDFMKGRLALTIDGQGDVWLTAVDTDRRAIVSTR